MSERQCRRFPHPAIIYLIMLVLVIMISWIGSILEIRSMERNSDIILQSVLSEQGIRWFIRNAAACFSTAPAGEALMILMAMGIGQGSGYFRALRRMRLLSPKERVSLIISMVVLLLYILFIVMDFLFGSYSLLGVSGTLKGSPMAEGAVFLCMLAIALPATVYGISVGSIRSADDCVAAFSVMIGPAASFLITMLVASQLIQVILYTNFDVMLGIGPRLMRLISFLLYWTPLPLIICSNQKRDKEV